MPPVSGSLLERPPPPGPLACGQPAIGRSAAAPDVPAPGPNPTAPAARLPHILPLGDTALTVDFGDVIDPELNRAVLALEQAVAAAELPGVLETVPSYRALMVLYDPTEIGFDPLAARLRALLANPGWVAVRPGTGWIVPVCYAPPFGLDSDELGATLGLGAERLAALHARACYNVYMVGFAPGFTYLGGLDPALAIPRRATPRPEVPAGSVMVGGRQAAIVSVPIPTGWYVLGRTPLLAFDPDRPNPFLFRPGDTVRFRPVPPCEYAALAALPAAELAVLAREPLPCPAS
ncbi:MAG: 5-oxoprolinase subunit PxpB [Proteobacteria bacterium]|nr:5-oxoprolinase subunit PxpB [Pseudomonadota bacterium]